MDDKAINQLAEAIFSVNRHAKTALQPKFLYDLKKAAIQKLLAEGHAKKVGLQFSANPKNCQQRSDCLVQIGLFFFHIPPSKEDFATLPHLGKLDDTYRNPRSSLSINRAKKLLMTFTNLTEETTPPPKMHQPKFVKPVFKRLGER